MFKYFLSYLFLFVLACCGGPPAWAQTYIKGPALIEGVTVVTTSGATTILTKDSQTNQRFTGTMNHTVQLPDATTIPIGRRFYITNRSSQSIDIDDASVATLKTIPANSQVTVVLVAAGSAAGTWDIENAISDASQLTGIVEVDNGGTGLDGSTAPNGYLLIGDGSGYTLNPITGTANQVNVTNGAGTIGLSLPQDIATTSTPQFNDVQVLGTGLGNRMLGRTLALASSTGLVSGGVLSVGAPASTFSITAGSGEVVDVTNPSSPVVTPVTWSAMNNVPVTNIGSQPTTYILIDSTGAIVQQSTYPTPQERRDYIFIGRLNHFNFSTISFADTFPDYKLSPIAGYYDLTDALAPFRIDGLAISTNGANLSFNLSTGQAFFRSSNYASNIENPNYVTINGGSPMPFRKMTQTTTVDGSDVTVIDPVNYDVGGTVTAVGGSTSRTTIQRVFAYKSGAIRVAYGQNVYSTFANAISALNTDSFVPNPTIAHTAILIGYIVVQRTCTDLTDTTCARLIPAGRFDSVAAASGGITTLQQAYLNSVQPQITLNSTQLGIQVRDASTPIASTLFAIQNNAGSTSYLGVDVNGISTTNFVGSGTTGAVRVHNLTSTQKNALTAANGMIVYDTTVGTQNCYFDGRWGPCSRPARETQTPTAGGTISIFTGSVDEQFVRLTPASAVTLSSTPFSTTDPVNGYKVTACGTSDTNTTTFPASDVANGVIKYSKTLGRGDCATWQYFSTDDRWFVISTTN